MEIRKYFGFGSSPERRDHATDVHQEQAGSRSEFRIVRNGTRVLGARGLDRTVQMPALPPPAGQDDADLAPLESAAEVMSDNWNWSR